MHPRNLGSHMTIGPPARPQHRHANVKKLKQQVWQPKCNSRFYLAGKRMAARTFREKKQQQSRVFFDIIFYVYTHVGNRKKELQRVIANKGNEFHCKKNMKMS